MGRVLKSPDAKTDLAEIWVYIADDNYDAADRLIAKLDEKLNLLADFPGIGQRRDDLQPDLRSQPVGNYVLYYRAVPGGIELLRALHGARDVRRIFRT